MKSNKKFVCANCSYQAIPGDKYCRQCGREIGKGTYVPTDDLMECIYGPPPVRRTHKCDKCGYSWSTYRMIDREKKCPKCGGNAPCEEEDI